MGSTRRPNPIVALALALGLSGLVACAAFAHTDDGCVFEIHCRTCLWAANAIVVVVPAVVVRPVFEIVAELPPVPTTTLLEIPGSGPTSRGPPLSV